MNLTLELTTEQVIDFLQQMPPEEKLTVLKALAKEARAGRAERMEYAESKVRELCAQRGLDWDAMTEDERLYFIDEIVHEDREFNRYANIS